MVWLRAATTYKPQHLTWFIFVLTIVSNVSYSTFHLYVIRKFLFLYCEFLGQMLEFISSYKWVLYRTWHSFSFFCQWIPHSNTPCHNFELGPNFSQLCFWWDLYFIVRHNIDKRDKSRLRASYNIDGTRQLANNAYAVNNVWATCCTPDRLMHRKPGLEFESRRWLNILEFATNKFHCSVVFPTWAASSLHLFQYIISMKLKICRIY